MDYSSPAGTTGYFRVEKASRNGRQHWLLVDPLGNYITVQGMADFNPTDGGNGSGGTADYIRVVTSKYGDAHTSFCNGSLPRLLEFGWNSLAEDSLNYCYPYATLGHSQAQVPTTQVPVKLQDSGAADAGRGTYTQSPVDDIVSAQDSGSGNSTYQGFAGDPLPDFYNPNFVKEYTASTASLEHNQNGANTEPWIVGISMGDGDWFFCMRHSTSAHCGWLILAASPVVTWGNYFGVVFQDTNLYAKNNYAIVSYLQGKYGTGSAGLNNLNSAWSTDGYYDSWGTHAISYANEVVATSDGTSASYTGHTSHPPDLLSLSVSLSAPGGPSCNSTYIAGSDIHQKIHGPKLLASSSYRDKTVTLVFARGKVPAKGTKICATYRTGGWPSHITGSHAVADEDGSHSWMGDWLLNKSNSNTAADLNNMMTGFVKHGFQIMNQALRTYEPNHLIWSADPMDGGTRIQIRQALCPYVDVVTLGLWPDSAGTTNSVTNAMTSWGQSCNKPIEARPVLDAQADSPGCKVWGFCTPPTQNSYGTQTQRGNAEAQILQTAASFSINNIQPLVGTSLFGWQDKAVGKVVNQTGVVDSLDNAYGWQDSPTGSAGCSGTTSGINQDNVTNSLDPFGYRRGGEAYCYGDYIDNSLVGRVAAENGMCQFLKGKNCPSRTGSSDFKLAVNPTSTHVQPGAAAQFTITATGESGFSSHIILTCSAGLPPSTTFTFSASAVTPGDTPATSMLTISTTGPAASLKPTLWGDQKALCAFWALCPMLLVSGMAFRRTWLRQIRRHWLVVLPIIAAQPMLSCAGVSQIRSALPPTPAGTYKITINAFAANTTHTTSVSLVVQ